MGTLFVANGYIDEIIIDKEDKRTMLIGMYSQRDNIMVWKTTDGGITWNPSNNGLPAGKRITALSQNPKYPNQILLHCEDNYIYESSNKGASWNKG